MEMVLEARGEKGREDVDVHKESLNGNGTPDNNSSKELMKHNGKIIASNRNKAGLFAAS